MINTFKKSARITVCCLAFATMAASCTPERAYAAAIEESTTLLSLPDSLPVCESLITSKQEMQMDPWTNDELNAIARTLAGECYDDKESDKRLVCEVILNRVSDGRFGGSIIAVLSAKNQFSGYWTQSRSVTENDLTVAEQALQDWYDSSCKPLSKYLFFSAGENRENIFK